MSGARILVADDQEDIRDMARIILEGAGHRVTTVAGGRDVLAALRRASFDLVLLDISMPDMDGWTVLRLLRQDEATTGVPVALFSVKSELRDKIHGMQEGAIDYITKPFGVDELVRRVERLLGGAPGLGEAGAAGPGA